MPAGRPKALLAAPVRRDDCNAMIAKCPRRDDTLRACRLVVPLLCRLTRTSKVAGAVDQGKMGEGLREITHQAFELGFVLLAEQAEIVAQTQQPLKEPGCVVVSAEHDI